MKYLILFNCLIWAISCAPKYTASFQDYSNPPHHDHPVVTTLQEELIVNDTLLTSAILPEELTASAENKPNEFKREALVDLSPDTVITAKQDTILLKNGDKIVGQITEVTSGKLVCRVSEWTTARSSQSKKGIKDSYQVLLLKDVFLIKYANGTSESINFSEKVSTISLIKGDPKKNSLAIFGFVLGILSLFPFYGLLLSIPAILLSLSGIKSEKRTLAIAGIVLGVLGVMLGLAWVIYILYLGWL